MDNFTADLESYYSNEKLSDVVLLLREDEVSSGPTRKRTRHSEGDDSSRITLPGHSMVLLAHSGFCKAKLENWSEEPGADGSDTNNSKHSITISVRASQLDLAQRLIKGIYQKEPAYTDLDPAQLLRLLLLADQYEVPKVQAAVLDALQGKAAEDWPWQTVLDALDLPSSCAEQAGCNVVTESAVRQLQQQLGDLELVWANKQLQQQLYKLSFSVLLQLVQHDETRVNSEHTVAYTILEWYKQQPGASRQIERLQQLLQQVRMQHCSQLYIQTFLMRDKLVLECFSNDELVVASLCDVEHRALRQGMGHILDNYPAWTAAARPKSSRQQLLEWCLPADELQAMVQGTLDGDDEVDGLQSNDWVLQGTTVALSLEFSPRQTLRTDGAGANGQASNLGFFLLVTDGPHRLSKIDYKLSMVAAEASKSIRRHRIVVGFSATNREWGYRDFLSCPTVTSWQDVKAKLRLIHPDGCLHLTAEIFNIW